MRIRKIFCLVDPTVDTQLSLRRARRIALAQGARIEAYLCLGPDEPDRSHWLTTLLEPLVDEGIDVEPVIDRSVNWREAAAAAARDSYADLVVKATYRRPALRRWLLRSSDYLLLKTAITPVLFVKRDFADNPEGPRRLLMAVNVNSTDPERVAMRERVEAYTRTLQAEMAAELHVVTAFANRLSFVHPPDLARRYELPRHHAHVGEGPPEQLIAETAAKLDHPLVVIGAVVRAGVSGVVLGNTSERILNSVPANVVAVAGEGREREAAA